MGLRSCSTALAMLSLLLAADACACDCFPAREITVEASATDAIFIGVPRARSAQISRADGTLLAFLKRLVGSAPNHRPDDVFYEFDVIESLKGTGTERQRVYTAYDSAACGCTFQSGTRYIVFATRSGNELRTHLCTSTSRVDERSAVELNRLREALKVPPNKSLERTRER
jgi:hypothetical protein